MSYPSLTVSFLGTGTSSGIPMIGCRCEVCTSRDKEDTRLRSSVLVQSENTSIVIDTTPDFRYQMLRSNTLALDAVVFTHPHKDHIAGLDDIRAYNFLQEKAMPLYANSMTAEVLRRDFYYAFAEDRYPGVPHLELFEIGEEDFRIGELDVKPVKVWHHKMPVYGFRFGNFTYITDANRIDEEEKEKIRGSEVLVINALRKEKHISHFTLKEAINIVRELEIGTAYFTHISHQLGRHKDVSAGLPENVFLAYDGLVISI